MPVRYRDKKLLTPSEFEHRYGQRNPDKVPRKEEATVSWSAILGLLFVFSATNVLSAGHTIPAIQKFYSIGQTEVLAFIGFAGFVGIEVSLVYLMSRPERGTWEKLAIGWAFAAALTANLVSTFETVEGSLLLVGVAVIVGAFPPFMNLALGEIMHRTGKQRREEMQALEEKYLHDLSKFRAATQAAYDTYLRSMGLSSKEKRESFYTFLEAGVEDESTSPEYPGNVPDTQGNVSSTQGNVPDTQGNVSSTQGNVQDTREDVSSTSPSTRGMFPGNTGDVLSTSDVSGDVLRTSLGNGNISSTSSEYAEDVLGNKDTYRRMYPKHSEHERVSMWIQETGYSTNAEIREHYGNVSNSTLAKARKLLDTA